MSQNFARPLNTNPLANQFLTRVLGYRGDKHTGDLATLVMKAEILLDSMARFDTLTRADYRHASFSSSEARAQLRLQIFHELIELERVANDDDITLGVGGIKPQADNVKDERQAFILIGPPASGKSGISNFLADKYGAHIIDSDYAKRKFPEFGEEYGASLVHEESILVTFGSENQEFQEERNVLGHCVAYGYNMVIPKIGANGKSIRELRELLIKLGYTVHLTLIKLDRLAATKRVTERFRQTKRYVPLSLVFDGYGNDPIVTYFELRNDKEWASTGSVSTEGPKPIAIEFAGKNPAAFY